MRTIDIVLHSAAHISTLVNITNRYPFIIQLRQGRYVVDGKSILGVCSLEHSKPIILEAYSDHCDALMDDLQPLLY
ncbi:MAG: HPr family phosphocarrier protein [Clostridia bacterium]|nr:HPr family phosphocarrier protein [Clostridia bacterium]